MIAIINYGMGNLGSVKRKLDRIGISSVITNNQEEVRRADKLILPGVGHFASAVKELKCRSLWDVLNKEVLVSKKPILGICLGMQLMACHSEEGDAKGFGWFDANVVRFSIRDTLNFKIPHIGWNTIQLEKTDTLFEGLDLQKGFYFVHSYHIMCNDRSDILCTTLYEYSFVSGIHKENIFGLQFHPEKSHDTGEELLKNFVKI